MQFRMGSVACLAAMAMFSFVAAAHGEDVWVSIFDGKTLTNWDGNPDFWRVEDGLLTGETTVDKPTKNNTFIIWRGGETADFELQLEYKILNMNPSAPGNANSGIQYRSFEVPDRKWVVGGYQADFEAGDNYSGINYGENFRGILANRGEKTVIGEDHKPKVIEKFADTKEIQTKIKKEDWNTYHIKAQGFTFEHRINGVLTSVCTDEDKEVRRSSGILALQLHVGPPMKVQFKNIKLKKLPAEGKTGAIIKKKHSYWPVGPAMGSERMITLLAAACLPSC